MIKRITNYSDRFPPVQVIARGTIIPRLDDTGNYSLVFFVRKGMTSTSEALPQPWRVLAKGTFTLTVNNTTGYHNPETQLSSIKNMHDFVRNFNGRLLPPGFVVSVIPAADEATATMIFSGNPDINQSERLENTLQKYFDRLGAYDIVAM